MYKKNILIEDFIDIHFNGTAQLYESKLLKEDTYSIMLHDLIEDEYWNIAYLEKNNEKQFDKDWETIKRVMKGHNKQPVLYISSYVCNKEIETYKSKIDFEVKKASENEKEETITTILNGFSGDNPDDPYEGLSEGYKTALTRSFNQSNGTYKVSHYIGIYHEKIIATATLIYKNDKALIYNITTNKKYQRQGVCKELMSYIVKDLQSYKIQYIGLQTEKGYYTEKVYKNMGFEEFMTGTAYVEKRMIDTNGNI